MIRYRFPASIKLKKTDEFSSVFSFRRRINSTFFAVHYMPNGMGNPRIGIVVSKKVVRRAHSRNYMKRVIRELFRRNQHEIVNVDMVIRAHKLFVQSDFKQVEAELKDAIAKLKRYLSAA